MSSIAKLFGSSRFWLVVILVFAAFLRFYRLPEYLRFLGDEGRDVLVVKRMIVDHQWTLLGPTASVGGFYTGPIYYYFMLPFLWAAGLNPVGPAVMAALFGLATIILVYFFCQEFFDQKTALIAAFLVAVAPKMVEISRFSWNPNPMPFFTLLTIFSLYLAKKYRKKYWHLACGVSLGILYQLHYIDLAFIPVIGLSLLLMFPWRALFWPVFLTALGFLLGDSLFLIFELRHGFPNTKSVIEFIFRHGRTVAPRSGNPIWLINDITRILYETVFGFRGFWLNLLYSISVVFLVLWAIIRKEKDKIILLFSWWLLGAFGLGLYRGTILDHYFGYLFLVPLIFLAALGGWLVEQKKIKFLFAPFLAIILYFSLPRLYFWYPPNNQVAQTQEVDNLVLNLTGGQAYNFALITAHNSDHAYRYFLEIWGRPPVIVDPPQVDPQRNSVTGQLIVVCEQKCAPLGDSTWEVAGFGRAEIVQTVDGPAGIKVYKLVHYTGP